MYSFLVFDSIYLHRKRPGCNSITRTILIFQISDILNDKNKRHTNVKQRMKKGSNYNADKWQAFLHFVHLCFITFFVLTESKLQQFWQRPQQNGISARKKITLYFLYFCITSLNLFYLIYLLTLLRLPVHHQQMCYAFDPEKNY